MSAFFARISATLPENGETLQTLFHQVPAHRKDPNPKTSGKIFDHLWRLPNPDPKDCTTGQDINFSTSIRYLFAFSPWTFWKYVFRSILLNFFHGITYPFHPVTWRICLVMMLAYLVEKSPLLSSQRRISELS